MKQDKTPPASEDVCKWVSDNLYICPECKHVINAEPVKAEGRKEVLDMIGEQMLENKKYGGEVILFHADINKFLIENKLPQLKEGGSDE